MVEKTNPSAGGAAMEENHTATAAKVARNSFWNLAGWGGNLCLNFFTLPYIILWLGESQYGLQGLLISILAPLGLLDFGMGEATIKYVAEHVGRHDYEKAGRYLRSTLLFNLAMGLLGGVIIALLAGVLSTRVFNIPPELQVTARLCLYWVGITWCANQIRQTFLGAVAALQRYDILGVGTTVMQAATLLSGLAALWLGGDLLDMVRAQGVTAILLAFAWLRVAQRLLPDIRFTPTWDLAAFRHTFSFGVWQMCNVLGGILASQSQRWLLGILLPIAVIGYFNVGNQLVAILYMVVYRTGQVIFPAVSQLQGQNQEAQSARLTLQASWAITVLTIPVLVALSVYAREIITLWINLAPKKDLVGSGEFIASQAAPVVQILAVSLGITILFAIPNFFLLGTGRAKWLAVMAIIQGIISLFTSAILIPSFGLVGASWGTSCGAVVHVVVLILIWRRIMRDWIPGPHYFCATFAQYFVGLAMAFLLWRLKPLFPIEPSWIKVGLAGAFCFAVTLAAIMAFDHFLPGGIERRRAVWRMANTLAHR